MSALRSLGGMCVKRETSGTQSQTEDTQKSIGDEAIIKDGMRVGIILTVAPLILLGFMALGIKYIDLSVPDMVLYNNTGREIEIYLGNDIKVVSKDSSGIVDQPLPCGALIRRCQRGYMPFRAGTVLKKWTYEVVYPSQEYKKRWSSSRIEYRYQIEADGSIYLLKPDTEFPVHKLPPQPSGFPLVPKYIWGERAIIIEK
ncbi:MAG: hypothetical protein NTAFB01_07860 [Nitrospira sp.]